jgi:hypothetical protein
LLIDGKIYLVNGNNLISNSTPFTENLNVVVIVDTEKSNGTLGINIILNSQYQVLGTIVMALLEIYLEVESQH